MTDTPTDTPQPRADDDAERLTPHQEAQRLQASVRYTHDYYEILVRLISERNSRDAALREALARADQMQNVALANVDYTDAEVTRLNAALREAREEVAAHKHFARLAAADRDEFGAQLIASREEVERLREALTPFAMLGGSPDMQAYHDLEDDVVLYKNSGHGITAGDVRNARRVLGPTSEMHFRRSQPATPSPVPPPREPVRRDWCEEHNRGSLAETDGLCPECEARTAQRRAPSDAAADGGQPEASQRLPGETTSQFMRRECLKRRSWCGYPHCDCPDPPPPPGAADSGTTAVTDAPCHFIGGNDGLFCTTHKSDECQTVTDSSAAKASAEDVDRAKWLWDNLPLRKHENKQSWLDMTAAALSARGAEGERAGIEKACATVCYGCEHGWPQGYDERFDPEHRTLMHKAPGAGEFGHACSAAKIILALLPPAAPERK